MHEHLGVGMARGTAPLAGVAGLERQRPTLEVEGLEGAPGQLLEDARPDREPVRSPEARNQDDVLSGRP